MIYVWLVSIAMALLDENQTWLRPGNSWIGRTFLKNANHVIWNVLVIYNLRARTQRHMWLVSYILATYLFLSLLIKIHFVMHSIFLMKPCHGCKLSSRHNAELIICLSSIEDLLYINCNVSYMFLLH